MFALEPYLESYNLGISNIKLNNLENKIVILPIALSDQDGETEFYISKNNPNANSLNPSEYIVKNRRIDFNLKKVINTVSISTLMEKYRINEVSLLKMDCEGCEYAVLKSLDTEIEYGQEFHSFS